ncbi:unnamed protein product [Ceutorhynchus assimilis]|uniref:Uncharacterized protein n=1 Tax=Ceutorhynchus assimilis TaxID=467358 RepID=A0A9N9MVY9_9CUCU|nr:unnamed protein product [Ceutorhynchus assimilis]
MMRQYLALVALIGFFHHQSLAEETRLLDLEPNDAQNLIEQQDQTLKYAPKIESDVPAVRFLGEEPHNVLEDIYLAKQYHGQDGLGGYLYGYQIPHIAKNEQKKPSGDLKGAYNYINGAGQEIKVEYWDNGNGFHQTDNIPQILPKQVEDSPAVQAAKETFLKRWHEEAERNSHPVPYPYVNGQYTAGSGPQGQQIQGAASGQQNSYSQAPGVAAAHVVQGATSAQQDSYAQAPGNPEDNEGAYKPDDNEGKYVPEEGEESTGPPKGFFYAFDYPTGIITQDQGRALPVEKSGDLKNVYEENKQRFERQLGQGKATGGQYLIN